MVNKYDLSRFHKAHTLNYSRALDEIKAGRKDTHWIWYIFPQLKSLGQSPTSRYYGLNGLEEAEAFYKDPLLGNNLYESLYYLNTHDGKLIETIVGPVDSLKIRSCVTLFLYLTEGKDPNSRIFKDTLTNFFRSQPCQNTLHLLNYI